jgi:hypothetical protein
MWIAFKIGITRLVTGVICLIHGLTPGLFKKTGSDQITKMYEMLSRN